MFLSALGLWLLGLAQASPREAASPVPAGTERISFELAVVNLEFAALGLRSQPPVTVRKTPEAAGGLWYGEIMRRLPAEGPDESGHYVPFAAEYAGGFATRAWCDTNLDGDLTNDPLVRLAAYPGPAGARSFLADLRWSAGDGSRQHPIAWKIRVVLEAARDSGGPPFYRVQSVFGRLGTVVLEGAPHRALLFDGNGDGRYTTAFGDGLFVDLDDDRHFDIDPMSPAFGPFAVPFQIGGRIYQASPVDPTGGVVTLRAVGIAPPAEPPRAGRPAPDFDYLDVQGRQVRLSDHRGRWVVVYFWASWCGVSTRQAPEIRSLYERYRPLGLAVLGISYDTDLTRMEEFRRLHGHAWPTSFSGRMLWEDPVGRLYQARAPGTVFLIEPSGRLVGEFTEIKSLEIQLARTLQSAGIDL